MGLLQELKNVHSAQVQKSTNTDTTTSNQANTNPMAQSQSAFDTSTPSTADAYATYDEIIAQLGASGLRTTTIHEGKVIDEANFADYGAALSEEAKRIILESFDCEADYILQQEIASLFMNDNGLEFADFVAGCKALGLEIEYNTVKTTMIPDNKGDGRYDRDIEEHHLAVYTIRDPETGAEINVMDTNGNGIIELEELFMNQILAEASVNIDTSNFKAVSGVSYTATSKDSEIWDLYNPIDAKNGIDDKAMKEYIESREELNQKEWEQEVKKLAKKLAKQYEAEGMTKEEAKQRAERKARVEVRRKYLFKFIDFNTPTSEHQLYPTHNFLYK